MLRELEEEKVSVGVIGEDAAAERRGGVFPAKRKRTK